ETGHLDHGSCHRAGQQGALMGKAKAVFAPLGLGPLVDSHAHLDHEQFAGDLDAVIQRAQGAGVRWIVTIGSDLASSEAAVQLAASYPCVYATVGIHPHDAVQFNEDARSEEHTSELQSRENL